MHRYAAFMVQAIIIIVEIIKTTLPFIRLFAATVQYWLCLNIRLFMTANVMPFAANVQNFSNLSAIHIAIFP